MALDRSTGPAATVLDVGCGTGFHLPRFAARRAAVVGVEPHPDLAALARRRTRRLAHVGVLARARRRRCPLPDASVDVVHARWAYFFGPGCEPGLRRARPRRTPRRHRVRDRQRRRRARPSARWFRRGYPDGRPGRRRAVLVDPRLDPHPGRHGLAFDLARRPRGGGPHRVRPRRSPTRSWPSTRAPRSTTPSTCGGARSDASARTPPQRPASGSSSTPAPSRAAGGEQALERGDDLDGDLLERLAHRGEAGRTTWATWESSKPTTATSRAGAQAALGEGVQHAHGQGVGGADERRGLAPRRAARRRLATATRRCPRPARRARWSAARARACARIQPARRSSPMQESLRQPIQAIRVWPRSSRWSVASSVPAAPSTSTHGWRGARGRPRAGRTRRTARRRSSSQAACGLPR